MLLLVCFFFVVFVFNLGQVSGSDTSEDEARAGWVSLWGLGQGHYCGYLLKKSGRDSTLWRRRGCILAVSGGGGEEREGGRE